MPVERQRLVAREGGRGARIGPGKAALLESVQASGSIAAAARSMGMDYKRAWLLVDTLDQTLCRAGGRAVEEGGGGGAALTSLDGAAGPPRIRASQALTRRTA